MHVNLLLSAGLGAIALTLLTTAVQAGPSGLAGGNDQSVAGSGLVDKVTWYGDRHYSGYHRRYFGHRWYSHGHYDHRHYGRRYYGYRGYSHRHHGWSPRSGYRHW
jgi:hypothetical protein